jgi:hypothetical protein
LLTAPGWNAKSIRLIYAAACAHDGSEPKPLTPRDLLDDDAAVIVEVDDDLPTSYTDGMPDPKAGGETPTAG